MQAKVPGLQPIVSVQRRSGRYKWKSLANASGIVGAAWQKPVVPAGFQPSHVLRPLSLVKMSINPPWKLGMTQVELVVWSCLIS